MHGNPKDILAESYNMYGKALAQLIKSIPDPEHCLDSSNISAVLALSIYEVSINFAFPYRALMLRNQMMACTSRTAWVQHSGGVGHLVQLRGAASFQEPTDLE